MNDTVRAELGIFGEPIIGVVKGVPVEIPLISHIEGNLWVGGTAAGLALPDVFENLVSLFPWEEWHRGADVSYFAEKLYDKTDGFTAEMQRRARHAAHMAGIFVADGPTLVCCQAGLNRSGLVSALVLMGKDGRSAEQAIELLREKRHPMVLCNPTFERWLYTLQ